MRGAIPWASVGISSEALYLSTITTGPHNMGIGNLVQRGQRHRSLEVRGKVDKQTEIASHGGREGELGQNQGDPNLKPPIAEV